MLRRGSTLETEIKLRLDDAASTRRELARLGFSIVKRRVFETNTIFDTPGGVLRRERKLLRLRQAGRRHTIAFKGSPLAGKRHKSREELESEFANPVGMRRILEGLGYRPVFRYEKYRTEYSQPDRIGSAMLDQTPIGDFLELEGPPRWIDRTARSLGRRPADYITASYGSLYLEHCKAAGIEPTGMIFPGKRQRS